METNVPVVILAGGSGTRLGENTQKIPKPMVEIQGVPILDRIIGGFKANGFERFIISSGYKSEVIEKYFHGREDVEVYNTGINTQTGGRLLGVADKILSDTFMACYGDIITDCNTRDILNIHRRTDAVCTMLAVHPVGRFGDLSFDSRGKVTSFREKAIQDKWINGGYFCFSNRVFDYIKTESDVLETDVIKQLVEKDSLYCYSHTGFWQSVDTPKDIMELNENESLPCF